MFLCFLRIDLVHILLNLYLSISGFGVIGVIVVGGIVFLILNFSCSFLLYWKAIDFYIVILYPETLLYSLPSLKRFDF